MSNIIESRGLTHSASYYSSGSEKPLTVKGILGDASLSIEQQVALISVHVQRFEANVLEEAQLPRSPPPDPGVRSAVPSALVVRYAGSNFITAVCGDRISRLDQTREFRPDIS